PWFTMSMSATHSGPCPPAVPGVAVAAVPPAGEVDAGLPAQPAIATRTRAESARMRGGDSVGGAPSTPPHRARSASLAARQHAELQQLRRLLHAELLHFSGADAFAPGRGEARERAKREEVGPSDDEARRRGVRGESHHAVGAELL